MTWLLIAIMSIVIPQKWVADSPLDPAKYRWDCPYAHIPPRDYQQNIRYRLRVNAMAERDKGYRADIWRMCARDPLFWLNTFGFIYEPRERRHFAWVTYPFQDEEYAVAAGCIGKVDVGWDKSRAMAASWGVTALFAWSSQFHNDGAFLMVSRNEELVDATDSPKCLFWKCDYLYARQPEWIRPALDRRHLYLKVLETDSVIEGSSTTGDLGRGDRRTGILLDECGSFNERIPGTDVKVQKATQSVTQNRFYVSTPKGAVNEFAKTMREPNKHMVRIRTHWLRHPVHSKGAYRTDGQNVVILDPENPPPADYKFRLPSSDRNGGDYRSPWYDIECERPGATNELIEQELDIGYHGSDYPFFKLAMIERLIKQHCTEPLQVGRLEFDPYDIEPLRFTPDPTGDLRIWVKLQDGIPPARSYVAGADISEGTGASNSCMHIADRLSRRIVATVTTPHMASHDFGDYCVAICRWFHKALLAWESNGPGRSFEKRVMGPTCQYGNVWFRPRDVEERGNVQKQSRIPGWPSTRTSRKLLLSEYRAGLDEGAIINPDQYSVEECRDYKTAPTGEVVHARQIECEDPTGAGDNHGDRVISAALILKLLPPFVRLKLDAPEDGKIPVNSLAWRRAQKAKAQQKAGEFTLSPGWYRGLSA